MEGSDLTDLTGFLWLLGGEEMVGGQGQEQGAQGGATALVRRRGTRGPARAELVERDQAGAGF